MSWLDHQYSSTSGDIDNLSYPPSGGWQKVVLLGLLLPAWIGFQAWEAWSTEKAVWFGGHRHIISERISGIAAQWMAGVYLAVALFCFSRWCIGILASHRLFEIGTVISGLLFLLCLGGAFCAIMA